MPTVFPIPCPKGPVVVSTPAVNRYSGCPGVLLSIWRNLLMSSNVTANSPVDSYSGVTPRNSDKYNIAYNNMEACPFESTKRSRLGQVGFAGSVRRNCCHKQ